MGRTGGANPGSGGNLPPREVSGFGDMSINVDRSNCESTYLDIRRDGGLTLHSQTETRGLGLGAGQLTECGPMKIACQSFDSA